MQFVTNDMPDHEVLRNRTKDLQFPLDPKINKFIEEFKYFFADMKSPYGKPAGLAAPQVGHSLRIMIIQVPEEAKAIRKDVFEVLPPTVLINPFYEPIVAEGKNKDWEGCYSVPDKMGEVYRYTAINYQAFLPNGEKFAGLARGFLARLFQHETGHLNGELYTDLIGSDCRFGSIEEMMPIRKQELQAGNANRLQNFDQ